MTPDKKTFINAEIRFYFFYRNIMNALRQKYCVFKADLQAWTPITGAINDSIFYISLALKIANFVIHNSTKHNTYVDRKSVLIWIGKYTAYVLGIAHE